MTDDGKEFYQNPLRHLLFHRIFNILKKGPAHGYQIMLDVEKCTDGLWRPSTAMIYRALSGMEERDYVTSVEEKVGDRTRRVYSITPQGRREDERREKAMARLIDSIIRPALERGDRLPKHMLYAILSPKGRAFFDGMTHEHRIASLRQLKEQMLLDMEWIDSILKAEEDCSDD